MSKAVTSQTRRSRGKSNSSQLWKKCPDCGCVLWNTLVDKHKAQCRSGIILSAILKRGDRSRAGVVTVEAEGGNMAGLVTASSVLVKVQDAEPVVLKYCPGTSLTSAVLSLNPCDIHDEDLSRKELSVWISPFREDVSIAEHISITVLNEGTVDEERFLNYIRFHFNDRIIRRKQILKVDFYGKKLKIQIDTINSLNSERWHLITTETKWNFKSKDVKKIEKDISEPGGVHDVLNRISSLIDLVLYPKNISLSKYMKSVLLYGHSGTGKTCICEHLVNKFSANVFNINVSGIYSKFYGETEATIKDIFKKAYENQPSIIVIEDVNIVCPKRNSYGSEQEKRVSSAFAALLDEVHNKDVRVFILMTTNKIDSLDQNLRRCGRIDSEIEVPIPDKSRRLDILKKLLKNAAHDLSPEELELLAASANGFVGADLKNLCTQASMQMCRGNNATLSFENFQHALEQVKPSAMREVLVDIPTIRWEDIGGQEGLKLKLKQMIEWPLKHGESFERMGIKPPAGVLMYGPPGCSKTMIAKALANESKLNFLSIKGPELFSKWVGESERAVRDLFRKARQVAPSIVFFDEIDALGGERSNHNSGSNVQERVLAQLLTEMDGISSLGNVTIIAATNRPDKMDAALLRPGRLDHIVYVSLPDEKTRLSILRIKMSKMPISLEVNIENLVKKTVDYSGAEIQAVCQEAALKALEEDINSVQISQRHFDHALTIVQPRTSSKLLDIYTQFERTLK